MTDTNAPREKLAQSLSQLSHYLRSVAKDADAYALALANGKPINGAIDSSDEDVPQPKGRKRKSPDDDDGKRKKRAKKEKDPNAPKRPATSYILYQNDCRQSMKEKNPGLNNTELLRYISETWKSLPEQEKSSYEAKAAKLKHDYEDAAREYGGANGKPVEPPKVKKPTPVAKPASVAKPVDSDEEESGSEEEAPAPKPVAPKSSATKPTAPKVSAKPASKAKAKPAAVVEDSEEEGDSLDDEPLTKKVQRQEESSGEEGDDGGEEREATSDEIEQPLPPFVRGGARRAGKLGSKGACRRGRDARAGRGRAALPREGEADAQASGRGAAHARRG